jgi:hypothetical protein
MEHDFDNKDPKTGKYLYRKYADEKKDCRGLMDYIDDGVGWSACSALDFSFYLYHTTCEKDKACEFDTANKIPCLLKGNLI